MNKIFFSIFILCVFLFNATSAQTVYTFSGNGNWSDTLNWTDKNIPPSPIPNGASIIINPANNGECLVDVPIHIPPNVNLNVQPGTKLKVIGDFLVHYDSTIVLKEKVYVVDTNNAVLTSTPSMIDSGIYKYLYNSTPPVFSIGDILVGPSNKGYIRKITSFSLTGNSITFQTNQGSMEDVFKQGYFKFPIKTDNQLQRPATNGYTYSFNNLKLYQNGPLTVTLNNGNITLDPDWLFSFDYQNSKLNYFEIGCQNANLTSNFEVAISATQAVTLLDKVDTLKRLTRIYTQWIPVYGIPVPVVIEMNLDFICKYNVAVDANISRGIVFNSNNTMSLGLKYSNSNWVPVYKLNTFNTVTPSATTGNANAKINMAILPTFSFKLYGLAGPYISTGLEEEIKAGVTIPSLDWDFSAGAWLKTTMGVNANILGNSLFDFNEEWNTDTLFYNTPFNVVKISGDNQIGQINQNLSIPVKIGVSDNLNKPQSDVPVYFTVGSGGGTVQNQSVLTDNNGYAETVWKMGTLAGSQTLNVIVKKSDGNFLQNVPVKFTAMVNPGSLVLTTTKITATTVNSAVSGGNFTSDGGSPINARGVCWSLTPQPTIKNNKTVDGTGTGNFISNITGLKDDTTYYVRAYAINATDTAYGNEITFTTDGTFTDTRDGQVYTFTHIGKQTWMKQNLNYDAPGSWCNSNDPYNCKGYGRLYDWNNALTVGIAGGFHLPSKDEWDTLMVTLGGGSWVGGSMKDTAGWNGQNTGATNESGFSGNPGGARYSDGTFDSPGLSGFWWSSTTYNLAEAWCRGLHYNSPYLANLYYLKNMGLSIRGVR